MTSERRRPVDRLARVTLRARGLLPEMGGPMGILLVLLLLETLLNSALPPNQVPQQLRASAHQLTQITSLPLSLAQTSASHPDAPKLIPLSALDRYQEGAELKLFCAASAPPSAGRLGFEWRKNHAEQLTGAGSSSARRLHISPMDDSSSMLRINQLEAEDSGNYTCLARNQHGFDSSTVRVNVNVRLKWIREPPSELQVRAGKPVQLECDATGQPAPLISWTSLKDHQTINSKVLRIDRAQVNDSGIYECRVAAAVQQRSAQNFEHQHEQLRKLVRLVVNGK